MASLVRSIRNSGARFFDESRMEPDDEILDPVLADSGQNRSKKLRTIPLFSFHLLVSTAISVVGISLAATWEESKRCEAYFIMLYLRAAFWVVTFLFDHFVQTRHKQLRLQGYHQFHRTMENHRRMPLAIVSLWNCALLTIATMIHQYYGENFAEHCIEGILSPVIYVTLFTGVENLIFFGLHLTYMIRVLRFNKSNELPDALQGTLYVGSVGLTQRNADIAELLEKQSDMIVYLTDHNLKLNKKLMELNAEIRNRQNIR